MIAIQQCNWVFNAILEWLSDVFCVLLSGNHDSVKQFVVINLFCQFLMLLFLLYGAVNPND